MNNNPKCFCGRDAWRPVDGEKHYCIFHSPKIEEKKRNLNIIGKSIYRIKQMIIITLLILTVRDLYFQ